MTVDVLLVVGDAQPPARVLGRARSVHRVPSGHLPPDVIGAIRARVPREVGVFGATPLAQQVATELHQAGLPVAVLTTDPASTPPPEVGIDVVDVGDHGPVMEVADSLIDLIGDTPMVRLNRVARDLECQVLVKLEFLNPGGSVKDRPALQMIDAAERAGLLGPGGTIVEPTSGNTGVGLAIVAAQRRYRCIFTMPDKIAREKVALLRAYGAEVIVCPTAVDPDHPDSYYSVAKRLTAEIPGAYSPDQYHNPENPRAHELTTGPEIWRQTAGRITHFVAGAGTGGTLSGVGGYLKSKNPAIKVIGADPEGSVYSGGSGRPYLVEGIGEDFWPTTYDESVIDRAVMVSDSDSFLTARRVTREEGMLLGGSGGTAIWAALEVGRDLGPDDVMVVLIPDSGRGYLSKIYSDEWMADHGFLRAGGETVADLLARKHRAIPALVHVHPDESARDVIEVMREFGVSQVPVVKAEPPLAAAEVVGAVAEKDLMEQAFRDPTRLERPVSDLMGPPLPTLGSGETLDQAVRELDTSPAAVVLDRGHPVGILTRSDVLEFLAQPPRR